MCPYPTFLYSHIHTYVSLVRDVKIKDPVFIVGAPRIGSTLLHNLINEDPLNRSPLLWEMRHPTKYHHYCHMILFCYTFCNYFD